MDKRLAEAFFNDQPPFDGETLCLKYQESLNSAQLFQCLKIVHSWILKYIDAPCWLNCDWHFHDGYVEQSVPITAEDIKAWLSSEQSMIERIPDDDYVAYAIYTDDMIVFWRTEGAFIDQSIAKFDVTAPKEALASLQLPEELRQKFEIKSAGLYFCEGHTCPESYSYAADSAT